MDPETQAHIDGAKRPAEKSEPRRLGDVSEVWTDNAPASRYVQLRRERGQEKLEAALDRMVPVIEVEVIDAKIWDPDQEEFVDFTGTVFRIEQRCLACDGPLNLDSVAEPDLNARAVAAGRLRRRPGMFRCDACIEKIEAEQAEQEGAAKLRDRITTSDLPDFMQAMLFNEMIPAGGRKYVVEKVREWAAAESPTERQICIWGAKGSGKTRLAATAAWARLQRWPVRWVSLPVLMSKLGASFNDDGRKQAISVLTGRGPLILDDVARDDIKVSDWAKTQLFTAIDTRIQSGAPLLITTNMAPDRLEPLLGGSVMSRIAGMAVYELPGRDQRLELSPAAEAEAAQHGLQDPEEER